MYIGNDNEELFKQFKSANGISSGDSKSIGNDFLSWIVSMDNNVNKYRELLKYISCNYSSSAVAEIGKCDFDSVVLNQGSATIVSPYMDSNINSQNRIINAKFKVGAGMPIVYNDKPLWGMELDNDIIMTSNPYNFNEIFDWIGLDRRIVVGIFGDNNDFDKNVKIQMLTELKEKLGNRYKIEGESASYGYNYVLYSDLMENLKTWSRGIHNSGDYNFIEVHEPSNGVREIEAPVKRRFFK